MRFAAVSAAALSLALAACGDSAPADEVAPTPEASATEVEATAPPVAGDTLDLNAQGINVPAADGSEALSVPFGSLRSAAEASLGTVLGKVLNRDTSGECGYEVTSYEGMGLHFRDGKFVGYYANTPYVPTLSQEEMIADPQVELVESTIDGEFTIGSGAQMISGVFVNNEVRALWAGEQCIAR